MSSMEDQELNDGTPLNCALQLFQHTAEIVDLFNFKCPLRNMNDIMLKKLNSFYFFMLDWRENLVQMTIAHYFLNYPWPHFFKTSPGAHPFI